MRILLKYTVEGFSSLPPKKETPSMMETLRNQSEKRGASIVHQM